MKRQWMIRLLAVLLVWLGSAPAALGMGPEPEYIEIKEKMFIAQSNDVYLNPDEYQDKTLRWQGIYTCMDWGEDVAPYHCVFRYGPGCCGDDGMAGFEVAWDGDYPELDSWVEAEGILEAYEENGIEYLRVRLHSLAVLEERGAEFVSQ